MVTEKETGKHLIQARDLRQLHAIMPLHAGQQSGLRNVHLHENDDGGDQRCQDYAPYLIHRCQTLGATASCGFLALLVLPTVRFRESFSDTVLIKRALWWVIHRLA